MKEYQEEGKILIKFVKLEENDADIKTHQAKIVWGKDEITRKDS